MTSMQTQCVIAGGGPAGLMAGFLLARAGVDVVVLEKHKDFLRDFRGDTIHPSTLTILDELGLREEFLQLPHQEIRSIEAEIGGRALQVGDLSHLPVKSPFIALLPQWDFLDFIAQKAKALPRFRLLMSTEATGLMREDAAVTGLLARTNPGDGVGVGEDEIDIAADLVIGADGRGSRLRAEAGFAVKDIGAPIDVLWFRIPWRKGDPETVAARIGPGRMLVMIYRGDYWQCALVIAKGGYDAVRDQGIEAFRAGIAALAHRSDADEIGSWDDVKLLTVTIDRLEKWSGDGLLFIGDAAHAMSPIGGVGINLAIQDAVAAANLLWAPLSKGRPSPDELARVKARRLFPAWATQAFQVFAQDNFIQPILKSEQAPTPPLALKMLNRFPLLQRLPARFIGLGARPEHVKSPAAPGG